MSESNITSAVSGRNVVKPFGSGESQIIVLGGVSVEIVDNEFFTLLGPSGCGKTTLLRPIAGFGGKLGTEHILRMKTIWTCR